MFKLIYRYIIVFKKLNLIVRVLKPQHEVWDCYQGVAFEHVYWPFEISAFVLDLSVKRCGH